MQPQAERAPAQDRSEPIAHGPSADFICAISEFLDTDPSDLLVELGYYKADPAEISE